MSSVGYIYVTDWKRFQHYRHRRPSWIKVYLDLLESDEFLELSPSDRCLLLTVWMVVAEYGNGRARADQSSLRARAKTPKGNLDSLIQAGWIEVRASKALAPERETEKEEKLKGVDTSGVRRRARARSASPAFNGELAAQLEATL